MEKITYLKDTQLSELIRLIGKVKNRLNIKERKIGLIIIMKHKKNIQKFFNDSFFYKSDIQLIDIEIQDLIDMKLLKFISKKEEKIVGVIDGPRKEKEKLVKERYDHDPFKIDGIPPQFWEEAKTFLTKKQQIVLQMRYLEKDPVPEIAETLEKCPGTVYKHLRNIKKILIANLEHLKSIYLNHS